MATNTITKRPPETQAARNTLRGRGWTITSAASELKVTRHHLSLVLNGHRVSRRILKAVQELPENPNPA
jgi:transcriptional regulator